MVTKAFPHLFNQFIRAVIVIAGLLHTNVAAADAVQAAEGPPIHGPSGRDEWGAACLAAAAAAHAHAAWVWTTAAVCAATAVRAAAAKLWTAAIRPSRLPAKQWIVWTAIILLGSNCEI